MNQCDQPESQPKRRKSYGRVAKNRIDLTGQRFGRLTVIRYSHRLRTKSGDCYSMWLAVCDCGTEKAYRGTSLRVGNTTSCGCLTRERSAEAARIAHTTHGMTDTPTWKSWKSMHDRCLLPAHKSYERYKDFKICDRWLNDFEAFLADMGERPPGTTLERIDNEGDYTPSNCRWATPKEQARNRRSNLLITANGKTKTAVEWAEELGMRSCTLVRRARAGMPPERILARESLKKGQPLKELAA